MKSKTQYRPAVFVCLSAFYIVPATTVAAVDKFENSIKGGTGPLIQTTGQNKKCANKNAFVQN